MWYKQKSYSSGGKSSKKKSVFGGEVKSHQEIQNLHKKINKKQAEEFEEFHKNFEKQAENIWGNGEGLKEKKKERPPLTAKEKLKILSQLQLNLKKIINEKKQNKNSIA